MVYWFRQNKSCANYGYWKEDRFKIHIGSERDSKMFTQSLEFAFGTLIFLSYLIFNKNTS